MTDTATFAIIDTETGGLQESVNPLLSVAIAAISDTFTEIDGFSLRCLPPAGTLLEVPTRDSMGLECKGKRIDHWVDVFTGARAHSAGAAPIISAYAAEVNGYIKLDEHGAWDLAGVGAWHTTARPIENVEHTFRVWLRQMFGERLVPVGGYNCPFDRRYIAKYMPKLCADFYPTWFDVCDPCKKWVMDNVPGETPGKKPRKSWKLTDMCKHAGYEPKEAHEAYSDVKSTLVVLNWLRAQSITVKFC
jgi:hypothetical protein